MKNYIKIILVSAFLLQLHEIAGGARKGEWDALIRAIETGEVNTVKRIVPRAIGRTSATQGGKTPLQMARFHLARHQAVVNYLEGLEKTHAAKVVTAAGHRRAVAPVIARGAPVRRVPVVAPRQLRPVVPARQPVAPQPAPKRPAAPTRGVPARGVVRPPASAARLRVDPEPPYDSVASSAPRGGAPVATYRGGGAPRPQPAIASRAPRIIKFYNRGEPYFDFTNFAEIPVSIDGALWPTTEHYFQAQKSTDSTEREIIRGLPSARDAFQYAQSSARGGSLRHFRTDWERMKDRTMLYAVMEKFTQHPRLRKMLLDTGDAILVEATGGRDTYWGVDTNGVGGNRLGVILMIARTALRRNLTPGEVFSGRYTFLDVLNSPAEMKRKWF